MLKFIIYYFLLLIVAVIIYFSFKIIKIFYKFFEKCIFFIFFSINYKIIKNQAIHN